MPWELPVEDSEERPIPLPDGPPVNPFTDSSVVDVPFRLPETSVEQPLSPEEALRLLEPNDPNALSPEDALSILEHLVESPARG